jgi:hypothetical protein
VNLLSVLSRGQFFKKGVCAYAESLHLRGELAPMQQTHSAQLAPTCKLAPTHKLVPTQALKNSPQDVRFFLVLK